MTEFINRNRKQLTRVLYIVVTIAVLLFLADQLAGKKAARILQTLISGVLVGGVYGLVALGIVVINKASGVFNFAHGWMMVVGAMIFWSFFTVAEISLAGAGLLATATMLMIMSAVSLKKLREPRNLLITAAGIVVWTMLMTVGGIELRWLHAIAGTVAGAILMGLAVERFSIRPLIGQPLFTAVLMTLAIAEVLHGVTQIAWGTVELNLPIFVDPATNSKFKVVRLDAFQEALGGVAIVRVELVIAFVLALVAFVGFILFFRYTSVGLAMRATSEDQQLAQSVGLRVRVILAITWGDRRVSGQHRRGLARWSRRLVAEYQLCRAARVSSGAVGRAGVDQRGAGGRHHHRHRRAIRHLDQLFRAGRHRSGALCCADVGAGGAAGRSVRRKAH